MLKILESSSLSPRETWASSIRSKYARSVEAIIEVGRELIAAKASLPHGEFETMTRRDLPFKERAAQMYMAVARNERLLDPAIRPILPAALVTLHTIARLESDVFEAMLADGVISAEKTHQDITLASDLYKVRLRGEREKPQPKPLATVLRFAPTQPISAGNPQPEPQKAEMPAGDIPVEAESTAISGEYIPAKPAAKPEPVQREGLTIDVGQDTGIKQYKNQNDLLRHARKMLDGVVSGKPISQADALAWVAAYDSFKMGL